MSQSMSIACTKQGFDSKVELCIRCYQSLTDASLTEKEIDYLITIQIEKNTEVNSVYLTIGSGAA